jgi:Flp pilus assembly protein TadD
VSLCSRSALYFIILTGAAAQSWAPHSGPLDASNNEMSLGRRSTEGQVSSGTISVQELRHPLEGKALQIILKARGFFAKGDSAQGMDQLRTAMRNPDAEPYALSILATEHLKRGDYEMAIVELQDAIHLLPGLASNHSNLAFALGVRGRDREALREAQKAVQLDPAHPKYRYVLGQILLQMGRREEAAFHLKLAAEEIPGARALLGKYFGQ